MEQALIMEGMPVEEIQRLCDVHAAVSKAPLKKYTDRRNLKKCRASYPYI